MAIVEYKITITMTQGCVKAAPFIVKSLALILQYVFSTDYIYYQSSVGPKPDTTLIFTLIPNLISGNQVQVRISKIRLLPDIRVMSDIKVIT